MEFSPGAREAVPLLPEADSRGKARLHSAAWVGLYFLLFAPAVVSGAHRGWPLAATQVIGMLALLCWLLGRLRESRVVWRTQHAVVPLGLLVVFVLLQIAIGNGPLVEWALAPPAVEPELAAQFPTPWLTVGSVAPRHTGESLLVFIAYFTAYLLTVNLVRRRHLESLLRWYLALGGVVGFLALANYLAGTSWTIWWRPARPTPRLDWSFANPDHFGAWLAMGVALGVGPLFAQARMTRPPPIRTFVVSRQVREAVIRAYFPFIAVAVMSTALVFTLSRGAVFSLAGGLLVIVVALGHRGEIRRPFAIVGGLLTVTLLYAVWIGLDPLVTRLGAVNDFHGRWLQSVSSLPILNDFPLFGVGLGAYRAIYPRYQTPELRPADVYFPYAHNDVLQLVLELGLIGTALVVVVTVVTVGDLVWALFRPRGISHDDRDSNTQIGIAALAAVVCLVIHSLLDFSARIPANGILAAVCLGISRTALSSDDDGAIDHDRLARTMSWPIIRVVTALIAIGAVLTFSALTVRSVWIGSMLDSSASTARSAVIETALRVDPHNGRALEARAALREEKARELWKSRQATTESRSIILAAIEDRRRTLTLTPTDPACHEGLAWAEQAAAIIDPTAADHHRAAAVSHMQRAVALAPGNVSFYWSLVAIAAAAPLPRLDLALRAARKTITLDPAVLRRLVAEVLPDDLTEAEWLIAVPETALDRARLAAVLDDRGYWQTAHGLYEKALELPQLPDFGLVRWLYARALMRRGALRHAIALIEPVIERNSQNPELLLARADALAAFGEEAAAESYRAAVAVAERTFPASAPAASLFAPAPPELQALIAQRLGDARVSPLRYRRALAQYLLEHRRWPDALAHLNEIVAKAPDDALAHVSRGVALEGMGDLPAALAAYRKAGTLERSAAVGTLLATKLWEAGNFAQAIAEWRSVIAQSPHDVSARLSLARALLHVGDRIAAFVEYQQAIRLAPENLEAQEGFTRLGGLRDIMRSTGR